MAAQPYRFVDIHSHGHEYPPEELARLTEELGLALVVVGEDVDTSARAVALQESIPRVAACVGVHPWTVNEVGERDALAQARRVISLALEKGVRCLGEVGLDTKFVAESIEAQRRVFQLFLEAARDHNMMLNLHTAGTWEEVYNLLVRYDVPYANFHWYTGPPQLLREIEASGYTISINPAVKIQRKHREVVKQAPLTIMLTESDAPYNYRGIKLSPRMVPEVVAEIASIKGVEPEEVRKSIIGVFEKKARPYLGLA